MLTCSGDRSGSRPCCPGEQSDDQTAAPSTAAVAAPAALPPVVTWPTEPPRQDLLRPGQVDRPGTAPA